MHSVMMAAMADEFSKIAMSDFMKWATVSFPAGHPAASMKPLFGSSKPVAPMSSNARRVASGGAPAAPAKPVTDVSRGAHAAGDHIPSKPIAPISGPLDFSGRATAPPLPMRKAASLNESFIEAVQKMAEMRLAVPQRLARQNTFKPAVVGGPNAAPKPPAPKPAPPTGALNPGGGFH